MWQRKAVSYLINKSSTAQFGNKAVAEILVKSTLMVIIAISLRIICTTNI